MSPLYLLSFLLLITVQVNSTPAGLQNIETAVNKFEKWIQSKAQALVMEFTEAGRNVKATLNTEISRGQRNIGKVTDSAIKDLTTWQELIGEECLAKGVQKLEETRKATIGEFLKCPELLGVTEDVGKIVHETFNITQTIMGYFDHALTGLGDCELGNYLDDTECVTKYIWKVIDNVRSSVPEIGTYENDMIKLRAQVSGNVHVCMYKPKQKINDHVEKIMAETKQCAHKS